MSDPAHPYRLFSVDDHLIEHANVWTDRVPAKYRDLAPHVVDEGDRQFWEFEGRRVTTMGLNAVAGKPREEWGVDPIRFSDMDPACYDPKVRAAALRADGIVASVSFPTLPRFGGTLFTEFDDRELADVCVRAWNDFVLDEWCAADPEFYVPMVICQLWDPELAAKEVERTLAKGAKALCFVENPGRLRLPGFDDADHWDPLMAVCENAGIPVCMHSGSGGSSRIEPTHVPMLEIISMFTLSARSTVAMMCSDIPRRRPGMKFVWSEGGIGWVPAAVERADRQWERHRHWMDLDDTMPSEIVRRNMWFCMIEEPFGITLRDQIGVDKILWECDYPHADTAWPHSQEAAHEVFAGMADDEIAMISHRNAENLFQFPVGGQQPTRALAASAT